MHTRNAILLILAAAVAGSVVAGMPDLKWHTIDGGGHMFSANGRFSLGGTIGQSDAGPVMAGGRFQLVGGFWAAAAAAPIVGDSDADGDVDVTDYAAMSVCFSGPANSAWNVCTAFDFDDSGTVELWDFAEFQNAFGQP